MLSWRAKASFFILAGPLMRWNGFVHRNLRSSGSSSSKVHLGPGQAKYLEGWVNVDANIFTGKCDIWADLRNKLPFKDSTVSAIYSHHVIEHLPDLKFHLREIFRCLKVGGVFRIGGPSGDAAIQKFVDKDSSWFNDFPDKRESLGGKLDNFILCRREHLAILTYSYLRELATQAGFKSIEHCIPVSQTNFPQYFDQTVLSTEYESTPECPHTLIVEGQKE